MGNDRSWCLSHVRCVNWPDNGLPPNGAMAELYELLHEKPVVADVPGTACARYSDTDSAVLVHCRAGLGRTGCFIAFCSLVDSILYQSAHVPGEVPKVSVMKTILELRRRRPYMVRTESQYTSIYR